jgi:hypothetical protein
MHYREKIYAGGQGVYLAMVFPGQTAHLSSEDGGIPAVSFACNASAKGDSGGGWGSQDL